MAGGSYENFFEHSKIEGNSGEYPSEHVMTFHLWFSSNSLNDDSIHLRLFQCTLTGPAVKWNIELPARTYTWFNDLPMNFLNHFQLLMCYNVSTELLSTFQK